MIPALYGLAEELEQTSQNELLSIVSYSTRTNFNWYDRNRRVRRYSNPVSAVEYQPSYNYQAAVQGFDNKYKYNQPVSGGTNISAGIDEGVGVLLGNRSRHNAFKTMIVMTDGQYNSGRHPSIAASDAADQGIEVFTVTFGSGADQNTMIQTAENGNGKHFHAPNGDALEEIFREIANIPPAAYIE